MVVRSQLVAAVGVMIVTLTGAEVLQAALGGVMRQWSNVRARRRDAYGFAGDGWGAHIEGACAEMALAKATRSYWLIYSDAPWRLPGDVGDMQVRSTPRDDGCLIVHREDPDDARFVLVIGRAPSFRLAGWLHGHDAKRDEWWREDLPRPAFFVPQADLAPIDVLLEAT